VALVHERDLARTDGLTTQKQLPLLLGSAERRRSRRQEDRRRSVPNKRQTVEIQVTHVGPDLQFATAEGLGSCSDGPSAASSAEEEQTA